MNPDPAPEITNKYNMKIAIGTLPMWGGRGGRGRCMCVVLLFCRRWMPSWARHIFRGLTEVLNQLAHAMIRHQVLAYKWQWHCLCLLYTRKITNGTKRSRGCRLRACESRVGRLLYSAGQAAAGRASRGSRLRGHRELRGCPLRACRGAAHAGGRSWIRRCVWPPRADAKSRSWLARWAPRPLRRASRGEG